MIYYDPQSAKVLLLEMTGSINGKCYKKNGSLVVANTVLYIAISPVS